MSAVYITADLTRQAHHGHRCQEAAQRQHEEEVLQSIARLRMRHPRMGVRKLYTMLQPCGMGRDRFERLAFAHGHRVRKRRNAIRTTHASRYAWYPNLIAGRELSDINQVWASDITYFFNGRRFYYLSFMTDVYSRRILGYSASADLRVDASLQALTMALRQRGSQARQDLIHHSDRGSQYRSRIYVQRLEAHNIRISMCKTALENAYAERINGIIKNEYLRYRKIDTLVSLQKELARAVRLYNDERPHLSLTDQLSPVQFEELLKKLQRKDYPRMEIYLYQNGNHHDLRTKNRFTVE